MGFLLGMAMGVVVGIASVFGFVYFENIRSKQRTDLASTIAAFAKMGLLDSRKILPGKYYPPWVVFSERQKLSLTYSFVKWLNQHLMKIWPYVDEAASELIKASVEPTLEQYKSAFLASLSFSKLTLGTVAPQLTGIWIVENKDSEGITMEFELQWDGNPNIVLDIRTKLGVALPIQVKNIGFTGVFRLIFKPLMDQFPCFGAVSFSMREKVIGGEVSSIPGLSDAIEETIHNALEDSLTWPVRIIIPIIPGDYSDLELKPAGILEVKLVQARGLTNKDIVGKSDPFAKVYVRPIKDRIKKSKTINNDLNPIWNEHFEFIVEDASTQNLVIKIYDDEGLGAAELIGCTRVYLNDLEPGKLKNMWLKLVKDLDVQRDTKYRGEVHVELLYCPNGVENELMNPFSNQKYSMTSLEKALNSGENGMLVADADRLIPTPKKKKDIIIRGVLSITVVSAENLPSMDIMGKADPYVVLQMKKSESKNKTRVVNESLNPAWNQTFDFVVEDGLHDMLMVEVWDHDTFGKDYIGRCIITLTKVIMEGEYEDNFPLEGSKSGTLNLALKWTAQPLYRDI
ncbi:Synaptotagmin-5 [Zostera marina]|uniref:Synaptotagmin-5 n=1 Tax=Zostera marina TaxID=29655 RepID=A0A0K9Q422_ZOSMR|nr:Synaptotagmin-5 [Zostera marina]